MENKDIGNKEKEKKYSEEIKKVRDFFKQKNVQNFLLIIVLLIVLISGSWIRVQNMDLLTDSTTGEKIPLALDPYYFLRVAETKIANNGELPEVDSMRFPAAEVGFTPEILPDAVIFLHKTASVFSPDISLRYINVISPVIFFVFGLIVFFFLIYVLTNSKTTALLSSVFLAFIPTYLYRTMAGFSDHESIGMFAFFSVLLFYTISLKFVNKKRDKKELYKSVLLGLGTGFLSVFTIASWGGIGNYVFMIIPASFLILWIFRNQRTIKIKNWRRESKILFYFSWIIGSVLFAGVFGYEAIEIINKYLLSTQGLVTPFVLGFVLVDYLLIYLYTEKEEMLSEKIKELRKYRILLSLGVVIVLGLVFLVITGTNPIEMVSNIVDKIIRPSGTGRLGETVAENRAPTLDDWFSQVGQMFFWIFYLGMIFVGVKFSEKIKNNPKKYLFLLVWIIFITGSLFSSALGGRGYLANIVYFGSILLFFGYMIWLYFNEKVNIKPEIAIMIAWLFFMLISGRGAIRMMFLITPFVSFMGAYALVNLVDYWRKSKEEVSKVMLLIGSVVVLIILIISFSGFVQSSLYQAENTGPSANAQWQEAMKWVRENTEEGSLFAHWWDYGYWVQYLGERPSVTDGGHRVGYWDHLIGRYLLTTPNPDSALSFMKTHNVSYLLIDPTDIGKYPAYSRIGSGEDMKDRASQMPVMNQIPEQTRETSNKTIRVYQGGVYVDEDIYYNDNGKEIFLPKDNAGVGGVILESSVKKQTIELGNSTEDVSTGDITAKGVYFYKGNQHQIPIKNVYYDGELYESDEGINATVYVLPKLSQGSSGGGMELNRFGSVIYLSPKVSQSLVAQLYLMDDPNDKYPTLNLSHKEYGQVMGMLKSQSPDTGDFVNYRGFRGPMKFWKVDYPEDIIVNEEFLETSPPEEGYGSLDDLQFRE